MDGFSIGGAWTLGFRFFAGRWLAHAAILIVVGILLPFGIEYAVHGGPDHGGGPAFAPDPTGMGLFSRPEALLLMAVNFFLQTGSFFASWRLGFDRHRSVAGALGFGAPAGLLAVLLIAAAFVVAGFAWRPFLAPDTIFLAVLVFLLPLILVSCLFFVSQTAIVAAAMILLLGFFMIWGAATGQINAAATITLGNGSIAVLLLLLSALSFWLAARLSCVCPLMADRTGLNLVAAIRESWRMTWEEQWAITRYLALVGGGAALLVIGGSIAIGAGATAVLPGEARGSDTLAEVGGLVIAMPFAFLAVLIPAGIYRRLTGEETPAEIFE